MANTRVSHPEGCLAARLNPAASASSAGTDGMTRAKASARGSQRCYYQPPQVSIRTLVSRFFSGEKGPQPTPCSLIPNTSRYDIRQSSFNTFHLQPACMRVYPYQTRTEICKRQSLPPSHPIRLSQGLTDPLDAEVRRSPMDFQHVPTLSRISAGE